MRTRNAVIRTGIIFAAGCIAFAAAALPQQSFRGPMRPAVSALSLVPILALASLLGGCDGCRGENDSGSNGEGGEQGAHAKNGSGCRRRSPLQATNGAPHLFPKSDHCFRP